MCEAAGPGAILEGEGILPSEASHIPGLRLLPNFVSGAEEGALVAAIDACPWRALARRRVQHYGHEFDYKTRGVGSASGVEALPSWVADIVSRIEDVLEGHKLNQLTVNEYAPGVGLAPHIDTHSVFRGPIVSLSLLGATTMELRRSGVHLKLHLPPQSLLVLSEESRYAWQHYIPHRKSDLVDGVRIPRGARRISLTFRQVSGGACACAFPQYCDSQDAVLAPTRLALMEQGIDRTPPQSKQSMDQAPPQNKQGVDQMSQQNAEGTDHIPEESEATKVCTSQTHDGLIGAAAHTPDMQMLDCEVQQTSTKGGVDLAGQRVHLEDMPHDIGMMSTEPLRPWHEVHWLEKRHVHAVYDAIARHFSATRFAVWPKVRSFIESIPVGGIVADVGCGNGKYFGVRSDLVVLGSDYSSEMTEVANQRLEQSRGQICTSCADVMVADALNLPYRACCDAVLCIAVLHHISSVQRRLRILSQIAKVLRKGGKAIATVWASKQEDPRKTIDRWQRIGPASSPVLPSALQLQEAQMTEGRALNPDHMHEENKQQANENCTRAIACHNVDSSDNMTEGNSDYLAPRTADVTLGGNDYMVPWHLPFHRAEAYKHVAQQNCRQTSRNGEMPGHSGSLASSSVASAFAHLNEIPHDSLLEKNSFGHADDQAGANSDTTSCANSNTRELNLPRVNHAKSAVVFQRYCHLYDEGELEALVCKIHGVKLLTSFYDRSNWCVIFQKI